MPTVNIYLSANDLEAGYTPWENSTAELRQFVAKELSCNDKNLDAHEVSIRLLSVRGKGMIAPIEVEVTAHNYPERAERADEICLAIKKFIVERVSVSKTFFRKIAPVDVQVWLLLVNLGHSWT